MDNLSYPKIAIVLICLNEYFERFSFFAIRNSLPIFLKNNIGYDEDTSTVIIHLFLAVAFATPVIGGIVADSFCGDYRSILYFSAIYIIGNILLALAAIPILSLPFLAFAGSGLALVALGTGGRKPCLSTFGGDQFRVPFQAKQQIQFFAICNWTIAAANLTATLFAPVIRSEISCFSEETCFSLLFFVAAFILILSVAFLMAGRSLYFFKKPEGNVIVKVVKCVFTAISENFKNLNKDKNNKQKPTKHWLDSAIDRHGHGLVADIKVVLRLFPLYIPMCCFSALYYQQSSRWTFQAIRMNRNIFGYTFEPDQFQITLQILLLVFIPLFEKWVYPVFAKCNFWTSQLARIFWGGIFAAISFLFSGILELFLVESSPDYSLDMVHVAWQLPQFMAMVIAEILFQISCTQFSYSEAPPSMKSLLQSLYLLTVAVGNLFVVFVAQFQIVMEQHLEFFFFSGLMFLNQLVFAVLWRNYNKHQDYVDHVYQTEITTKL